MWDADYHGYGREGMDGGLRVQDFYFCQDISLSGSGGPPSVHELRNVSLRGNFVIPAFAEVTKEVATVMGSSPGGFEWEFKWQDWPPVKMQFHWITKTNAVCYFSSEGGTQLSAYISGIESAEDDELLRMLEEIIGQLPGRGHGLLPHVRTSFRDVGRPLEIAIEFVREEAVAPSLALLSDRTAAVVFYRAMELAGREGGRNNP